MKKFYLLLLVPFFVWGASSITSGQDNYIKICEDAQQAEMFKNFRRHPSIRNVIEGSSKLQGRRNLKALQAMAQDYVKKLPTLETYERLGNPRRFTYCNGRLYSPCTIRYVKILADMRHRFKSFNDMDIIEIGGGYGGQCAIMAHFEKFKSYTLIDLPCVLGLARKFVDELGVSNVHTIGVDELDQLETYDLIVSNYAFSEIDAQHQLVYLEKVIKNIPRGYMTMNFIGTRNNIQALPLEKIKELLTAAGHKVKVEVERPQTNPRGKRNVLLTWGEELL